MVGMASVPTSRRLVVGVDLDEVCYPFIGAFRAWLVDARGHRAEDLPARTRFGVPSREWGFDEEAFLAEFRAAIEAGHLFTAGDPLPGAKEGLCALRTAGHEIVLITARAYEPVRQAIEAATVAWLGEHGLPYDRLVFDHDKTCVRTDVFLDDAVHNYDALEEAGLRPVLYTQPYNVDHPGVRVDGWPAFVEVVAGLAAT